MQIAWSATRICLDQVLFVIIILIFWVWSYIKYLVGVRELHNHAKIGPDPVISSLTALGHFFIFWFTFWMWSTFGYLLNEVLPPPKSYIDTIINGRWDFHRKNCWTDRYRLKILFRSFEVIQWKTRRDRARQLKHPVKNHDRLRAFSIGTLSHYRNKLILT